MQSRVTAVLTATSCTMPHLGTTRRTLHDTSCDPIPDLPASVNRRVFALSTEDDDIPPWRARVPRVPLTRVIRGQQWSFMSPTAGYLQVASAQVSTLIAARPSKLAMRLRSLAV
jgi:hypothetical protein